MVTRTMFPRPSKLDADPAWRNGAKLSHREEEEDQRKKPTKMSSSILEDLHQHVECLKDLLLVTAANNTSGNGLQGSASTNISIMAHQFDIRRAIRHIQSLLSREELAMAIANLSKDEGEYQSEAEALSKHDGRARLLQATMEDLVSFVTLDYHCGDATVTDLVTVTIPSAIELLETTGLPLDPDYLDKVLVRILGLLQNPQQPTCDDLILSLIELFNHYVTNHDKLKDVVSNNETLFLALRLSLEFCKTAQEQQPSYPHRDIVRDQKPPPFAVAVFVGTLVESMARQAIGNGQPDMGIWLKQQFLPSQSHHHHSSQNSLARDIEIFLFSLEEYGIQLIEAALRMFEDAGRAYGEQLSPSLHPLGNDEILSILQYATLATNFVVAIHDTSFYSRHSIGPTSRSLWRDFIHFVLHHLQVDVDDSERNTFSDSSSSHLLWNCQVASAHSLWRLAKLHSSPAAPQDLPMVVATILYMWKHASSCWNESTQEWIRLQLHHHPATSLSGRELRHSLEAAILSYSCFPDQQFSREPVDFLLEILFEETGDRRNLLENDPWSSWVLRHLSSPTCPETASGNSPSPNDIQDTDFARAL